MPKKKIPCISYECIGFKQIKDRDKKSDTQNTKNDLDISSLNFNILRHKQNVYNS